MKLISYVGFDSPVMVIEKANDLFPALDHIQGIMLDLSEKGDVRAEKCADFMCKLMEMTESAGFGNYHDVDNIEY